MRLVTLLLCSSVVFGQSAASSPEPKAQTRANAADQKNQNQDFGLSIDAHGRQTGGIEVLSDIEAWISART